MEIQEVSNEESHRALQMPVILESVFNYCSVNDLLTCRQVSRFWKDSSGRKFKRSAPVTFDCNGKISKFVTFWNDTQAKNCFGNFSFQNYTFALNYEPFWTQCGANIKVLELSTQKFKNIQSFQDTMYSYVPNMEKLILRRISIGRERAGDNTFDYYGGYIREPEPVPIDNWNLKSLTIDNMSPCDISWRELLYNFPGIQALNLEGAVDNLDEFFNTLANIRRESPHKLKLKHLNTARETRGSLWRTMHPGLLDVLSNPTLPLESLSIHVNDEQSGEHLVSILCANGSSLRKLELRRSFGKSLDPVPIFNSLTAPLANLVEIVLLSRVFSTLEFLKFTPNLARLSIQDDMNEDFSIVALTTRHDLQNIRLERCKELAYTGSLTEDDLHKLATWMPYVETLNAMLNFQGYAVAWERWRKLVEIN